MKAAMWGVGLVVMGLLGLVLINLFGNITVTNQFNYTTMKNAVQAAMLDSLDIAHYRAGFCLCTADGSALDEKTTKTFNDKGEYEFRDIVNDKCVDNEGKTMSNCVMMYGQYRIDRDKFSTEFQKRFESVLTNNKDYDYVIKEVIEYPPKVSVRVISKDDEFFPTDKSAGGYQIVNQLDAIIETDGEIVVTSIPVQYVIKTHHYIENTTTRVHSDDEITVNQGQEYNTNYYDTTELSSTYKSKYSWNGQTPANAKGQASKNDEVTYYYKLKDEKYVITTHHYIENTSTKVRGDDTVIINKGQEYNTKYYGTGELISTYKDKYTWNGNTPSNAKGKADKNIEVIYYYKANQSGSGGACTWHYYVSSVTCRKQKTWIDRKVYMATLFDIPCPDGYSGSKIGVKLICTKKMTTTETGTRSVNIVGGYGSVSQNDAVTKCRNEVNNDTCVTLGYSSIDEKNCLAVHDWQCPVAGGGTKIVSNRASSPEPGCRCIG